MSKWHIIYNGQQIGPMSEEQLSSYPLTPQTKVWCEGMAQWQPLYTIPELMGKISQSGPGVPPNPNANTTGKDKVVAGILALLLGGLGIHYFYCGKVSGGFISILLNFVTCGLWSIVVFIQAIMILVMPQEEFEQKYVLTDKSFPLF